jgi:glycosyltransferase involved in cell wall biosynthesis
MSYESFINQKKLAKKAITLFNTKSIKRYEFKALKEADCIIHVSENDMQQFDEEIANKSIIIPNTLPNKLEFIPKKKVDNNLLFVGSMSHYPNVEGILEFLENVWIDINRERKDINLLIVGKNPPSKLMRYDGKYNVRMLGFVENIQEVYRTAKIAITPINIGSGTRLKILEAMMNSTLNISSVKGAEGLCAQDSKQIIIAGSQREWAEKILYFLDNADERHQIEKNAYELVVNNYYYENYREKLRQCIGM